MPEVPPRYRTTYFAHIWDGGYAAGYYAYLWARCSTTTRTAWFSEHGGMTRANGQRFRDMILSRGGTQDPAATVPRVPRTRSERRAAAGRAWVQTRGGRPMSHPSAGRRLGILVGVVALALVVGGAGLYLARNPERSELD